MRARMPPSNIVTPPFHTCFEFHWCLALPKGMQSLMIRLHCKLPEGEPRLRLPQLRLESSHDVLVPSTHQNRLVCLAHFNTCMLLSEDIAKPWQRKTPRQCVRLQPRIDRTLRVQACQLQETRHVMKCTQLPPSCSSAQLSSCCWKPHQLPWLSSAMAIHALVHPWWRQCLHCTKRGDSLRPKRDMER